MKEVSVSFFYEVVNSIPCKMFTILGKKGRFYEGKGRKFKNAVFAKCEDEKYYVLDFLAKDYVATESE